MPIGNCLLCKRQAELLLGHVLPAFAFRWLVNTAGKSPIRGSDQPNKRVQDGPKEYWLCAHCERLFGKSETTFATRIFHPYFEAPTREHKYASWMMRFCVSLSWRALQYYLTRVPVKAWSAHDLATATEAEIAWREYLLGVRRRPGQFHQHIIPLDSLASVSGAWSPNLSRYLARAIDIDFPSGPTMAFTYSKLGRFIVLGFVRCDEPENWKGTRVDPVQGAIRPRKFGLPASFMQFVDQKARDVREALASVSERQREKMHRDFLANKAEFIGSDAQRALSADIEVFGSAAFIPDHPDKDSDG